MPFYDFQCPNNHRFELKQSFDSEPMAICPTCKTMAKRLISLVPVHFKGSGFYVNDYARKAEPVSEGSKDAGASTGTEKSSSVDKGSKTESSKDTKASESKTKSEPAKFEPSKGKSTEGKSKSAEGAASTKA